MTTCTTCHHWSPKNAGAMGRHGFGICVVLNTNWVYFAPHQTCTYHVPAKEDVVQGRVRWLRKLGIGGGRK